MPVVLVVEDEAPLRVLALSVLQHAGYDTLSAGSVVEAKAILEGDSKFDIVFTDINLEPDPQGGLTIGKLAGAQGRKVPVLYTSGKPVTDGMKELFAEKSEFLQKPYRDDQLVQAIARLLRNANAN